MQEQLGQAPPVIPLLQQLLQLGEAIGIIRVLGDGLQQQLLDLLLLAQCQEHAPQVAADPGRGGFPRRL